ncbi:2OG-Fe(II) oxygenase [Endozoicomonas arenosclerae]|uniref:2OG-Fe(II) oxygenase n=1 Tax=Endozoicomonas arenosclerae TaxID=1633495 RepID=UPI000B2ABBEF|nr:2OG-Fe(II) oxygenase [Endozoicomonas arenosclerae]
MNLLDLILISKEALTIDQCDMLIEEFKQREFDSEKESSLNSQTGLLEEASYKTISLRPNTECFKILHSATGKMITSWMRHLEEHDMYNTKLLKQSLKYSHDYRILKYSSGSKIHPHTDWDLFTIGSCSFILNNEFKGGDFYFFNGKNKISLNKGDAIIWPADCFWVHEVKEVIEGERYCANSFLTCLPDDYVDEVFEKINRDMSDREEGSPYLHELN